MTAMSLTELVMSWEEDADQEFVDIVRAAVERGEVEWAWDPFVDGVAGLLPVRACTRVDANTAYIVLYRDGDWEMDEQKVYGLQRWRFIVIGHNYWGAGNTLPEAKRQFSKHGGRLSNGYTVVEGEQLIGVDGAGRLQYGWDTDYSTAEVKGRKVRR
jgi:hypothetical protein